MTRCGGTGVVIVTPWRQQGRHAGAAVTSVVAARAPRRRHGHSCPAAYSWKSPSTYTHAPSTRSNRLRSCSEPPR